MNKFKEFIQKLFSFMKKSEVKISEEFAEIAGSEIGKQFAIAAIAMLKSSMGQIVLQTVATVETLNPSLTPQQKMEMVVVQVTALALSQGKTIATSLIKLLAELAVTTYKKQNIQAQ